MAHEVYYEFHQNLEQLRRHGARGGKATARHRRQRLEGGAAEERELEAARQVAIETTAAIGRLRSHHGPIGPLGAQGRR